MHDEDLGHLADHLELLATMLELRVLALGGCEPSAPEHRLARLGAEGTGAEPTLIRRVTGLLEEVLGRSLQQWQLPMIRTNDAGGRGN